MNLLPLRERVFGDHDRGVYARVIAGGEIAIGDELRSQRIGLLARRNLIGIRHIVLRAIVFTGAPAPASA
jgi:hypothetical protein